MGLQFWGSQVILISLFDARGTDIDNYDIFTVASDKVFIEPSIMNFCTLFQVIVYYQSYHSKAGVCKSYKTSNEPSWCLEVGLAEHT